MLRRETQDGVEFLHLGHGKANALDLEFCEALKAAFDELERRRPRALVVTGQGNIFCAGVDLPRVIAGGAPYVERFLQALSVAITALWTTTYPTVAAVNGHAIAGGCLLAIACDHVVAAAGNGRTGVPESSVGVPFPAAGLAILRSRAGDAVTRSLVLSGRTVPFADAVGLGLVDELAAEGALPATALAAAQRLAAIPPATFATTKQQLQAAARRALAEHGAAEDRKVQDVWRRDDVLAAVRAFTERTLRK
ncbi:MAG: enoyl-CoA hydratase/isomerase family protein [Planctomycetes bacterium]|nr:enoyl-CoA hydratase/isomerase family protein [Planctomycetota bacterium]